MGDGDWGGRGGGRGGIGLNSMTDLQLELRARYGAREADGQLLDHKVAGIHGDSG